MPKETGFGKDKCQKVYNDRHPVLHTKGSAKRPKCGCGSWLNHWLIYTDNTGAKCSYMGCNSDAIDGAHVQFTKKKKSPKGDVFVPTGEVFIVPTCTTHNRSRFTEPFFVRKDRYLINDKARDLCESAEYLLNAQNYFKMRVEKSSGAPKCGCSSHIGHYRAVTGSKRAKCAAMPCAKNATMAAPMRSLDNRTDYDRWIAPLCRTHAKPGSEIYIKRQAKVAAPDKHKACGS